LRHQILGNGVTDDPHWLVALFGAKTATGARKLIETVLNSAADRLRRSHTPQHWSKMQIVNPKLICCSNSVARKPERDLGCKPNVRFSKGNDRILAWIREDEKDFQLRYAAGQPQGTSAK
jgi:hypothetical protein